MEDLKLRDFEISFALEKDLPIEQFVFGNELSKQLNKELKLQNYSASIKCLFVVFQCFDPENKHVQTKERYSYRRKKNALEIYLNLDYKIAKKANDKALKELLIKNYLRGIEKMLKHKEFNIVLLKNDISTIFKAYLADN
jgi:hypothetical protein